MPPYRLNDGEESAARIVTNTEYGADTSEYRIDPPDDWVEISDISVSFTDNDTDSITASIETDREWTQYAVQKIRYQTRRFGAPRENNMRRDSTPEGEPQPTLLDPKIEAAEPLPVAVSEVADLYREHGYKHTAQSYPVQHIMDSLPTELRAHVSDGELEKAVIWWCVRDRRE
jgi:hypothetical protein